VIRLEGVELNAGFGRGLGKKKVGRYVGCSLCDKMGSISVDDLSYLHIIFRELLWG